MNNSNYYLAVPHLNKDKILSLCFNIKIKYLYIPRAW